MNRGKFIVIEGTDGSGKGTQVAMLVDRLKNDRFDVKTADFPQYDNFSGAFVAKYLRGEYGTANEVGPYRASVLYALDRYDKSFDIKKWLADDKIVVSNRYVSANMGHQTGKIKGVKEREKFLKWLDDFEYGMFNIPRPDIIILLYMPPEVGQKLVDQKAKRGYTKGKKRDIHEADLDHLKKASEAYLYVAKKYDWKVINCVEKGLILSREEINDKIYKIFNNLIK
jgi:dTMP kinase